MADRTLLAECAACDGPVSVRAMACPRCGHPNARASRRALLPVVALVVVMAVLLAWRFVQLGMVRGA